MSCWCLFANKSNKKQRRGRIILKGVYFTKGETFHLLWQPRFLRLISQYGAPSCNLQKRSPSLLQFGQEENIHGHSIESRAYWFALEIARVFPIPTGRVGIRWWNIFIIVNITPKCKRKFRGWIYVCPLQKGFPSPFSLARNIIYLSTHLKEKLTDFFLSYIRKKIKTTGMYLQPALALNQQLFSQQIDRKDQPLVAKWTPKYVFFHRSSYKNSCFGGLAYNFSVLVLI